MSVRNCREPKSANHWGRRLEALSARIHASGRASFCRVMRRVFTNAARRARQFAARNRSAVRLRDQPPKIGQSAKKRYEFAPTDAQYQTVRSCLNCVSAGPGRCPKTNKHRAWLRPIDPFHEGACITEGKLGRAPREKIRQDLARWLLNVLRTAVRITSPLPI